MFRGKGISVLGCGLMLGAYLMLAAGVAQAGSEVIDVDLDIDSMKIIKADTDVEDLYYLIDPKACICSLRVYDKHYAGITQIDCQKLKAHEKLAKYVADCKDEHAERVAAAIVAKLPSTAAAESAAEADASTDAEAEKAASATGSTATE